MPLHLLPHVHAVAIGEDLVILDTEADAYLSLPGAARILATRGGDGGLRRGSGSAALVTAGLAAEGAPAPRRPPPARPVRGLPTGPDGRTLHVPPRRGDRRRLALAAADLLWGYAGRSLGGILRRASRPGPGLPEAEVLRLAGLFARWIPWLPVPGKCLVRSFVLLRFLQRSGGSAAWVFGVRTWPFGAHCWLQLGEVALDDDPARLVGYAPLLAVGG